MVALLTSSCLAPGQLTRQHVPTGVSTLPPPVDPGSSGYGKPLPFPRYVAWAREQMRRARERAGVAGAEESAILDTRAPFEWKPDTARCDGQRRGKRGVLLIHGLTDSPFLMRDTGRHFRERCFLVRAILLPGHGTVPGDLLDVTYEEWVAAASYGIDSFAGQVLYHALGRDELRRSITALVLFSPAIAVASPLVPLANWHKIYSWALPSGAWDGPLFAEGDSAKYESFAKNAGDQVYLLTRAIAEHPQRRPLRTPVFIALSHDDSTVSSAATIEFFNAITPLRSPSANVLIDYTRAPYALDPHAPLRDRSSVHVGEGIVSFSHLAIPVRPDNPHYGRHATYRNCLAYERLDTATAPAAPDGPLARCRNGRPPADGVRLGETSLRADLAAASALEDLRPPLVLRRLTFNPDFEGMMAEVDAFVARVEQGTR